MTAPLITLSPRLRETPFSARVRAAGPKSYTVYNHMLLPSWFRSIEEDYRHLKSAVQVWDVACERQVEICGADAGRLVQMLTPRDLRGLSVGRCVYTPMVDEAGGMLNDPVTLKLAEDRYWVSIADSDLLLWVKGLAYGLRLEVEVTEPDVSPLAVQGPLADALMARVFGADVAEIRFFRFREVEFQGRKMVVARSGYSRQGGFEIYCAGSDMGAPLWDALFEAGGDLDVRAGCPNLIERVEGGLLSYGSEMTRANTPHECGLGRFCAPEAVAGCIGREALLREAAAGPARQIRSFAISGARVPALSAPWPIVAGGGRIGQVTSAAWSPDFQTNVALGMIDNSHWAEGTEVEIHAADGPRAARVRETPFI